jgi:hypothetical protein
MSGSWENIFPLVKVKKLPRNVSNHNPLVVDSENLVKKPNPHLFLRLAG